MPKNSLLRYGRIIFLAGIACLTPLAAAAEEPSATDHRAEIFDFKGEVRVLRDEAEEWVEASKNMVIQEGDQILTGKESHVDIVYDAQFLNIARIEEKTKAEFRSIEPTDVFMEDGTLFSALDGVMGGKYQISTPTAVAGVRGTHLDVGVEGGSFSHVAVLQDEKPYQSLVEVVMDGNNYDVREGQQMNFEAGTPEIKNEIDPGIVDRTGSFMENAQGNFPGSQEAAVTDLAKEEKAAEIQEEDSKPGSGPPGGNDDGGSDTGSPQEGTTDSDSDSLMDSLIPPDEEGVSPLGDSSAAGKGKTAGAKSGDEDETSGEEGTTANSEKGAASGADSKQNEKVDYGKAMEFLSIAGMGMESFSDKNGAPVDVQQFTASMMTNFGVDRKSAELFGQFVEKFSEIGGNFPNAVNNAEGGSGPMTGPMMFDQKKWDMEDAFTFEAMGIDPNQAANIDFNEFARIVTENRLIENELLVQFIDEGLAQTNPFYFEVLDALELDLKAMEEATLLAGGNGTELVRGGEVLGDLVEGDGGLQEKIIGVVYFNDHGSINATYEKILDSSDVEIQAPRAAGEPEYLIIEVDACNPTDPAAYC